MEGPVGGEMGVGTGGDHDGGYRVTQRKKKQERTKEEGLVEVEWAGREGRREGGRERVGEGEPPPPPPLQLCEELFGLITPQVHQGLYGPSLHRTIR